MCVCVTGCEAEWQKFGGGGRSCPEVLDIVALLPALKALTRGSTAKEPFV